MGKYSSPAVDGVDLIHSLKAVQADTGCKARIIISLNADNELTIRTEAFTEYQDVRIGVAVNTDRWRDGNGKLLARVCLSIHRVYAQAYNRAHTPPQKP